MYQSRRLLKTQEMLYNTCKTLTYLCPEQSIEIYTEKKLMLLQVFKEENLPEAKCTLTP